MAGHRVVFLGGADRLQVDPPDGKFYEPGDTVTLPDIQRANLTAAGLRFGAVPDKPEEEPPPAPPPPLEPAETSATVIEQAAPARAPATPRSREAS
jgi:hypothetical protein